MKLWIIEDVSSGRIFATTEITPLAPERNHRIASPSSLNTDYICHRRYYICREPDLNCTPLYDYILKLRQPEKQFRRNIDICSEGTLYRIMDSQKQTRLFHIMPVQTLLRTLVVVRCNNKSSIYTELLCISGKIDAIPCII